MSKKLVLTLVAAATAVVVGGCQPYGSPDSSASPSDLGAVSAEPRSVDPSPVATIGDRTISVGELDDFIMDELFKRASSNRDAAKLYEMRSAALERFIDRTIVIDAAAEEGVTPEDFLNQATSEIRDEEVSAYYEANRDQMRDDTMEQAEPRIRAFLLRKRATEVVATMRSESGVVVLLEPPRIEVAATGPSLGPEDASVTIVEFSDFQCPYCKRVVPTMHQIAEKYPDQVRIVFRHLPLDRIHDRARPAAEASACADKQGEFWAFHDIVFENNQKLSDEDLKKYAIEAGLDGDAFEKCITDREFQAAVQHDSDAAKSLGVSGTPAFFINGIPKKGAIGFEEFSRIIDSELARATPAS